MTERQPLIIDTDPGQDDAVAILLALASPEIDLLGITTVAGNVPLELTEVNARKICDLAGRQDVPVFAGLSRPLVRSLVTAEHVHGRTGLDGPDLPPPQTPLQEQHAVDFIIETVRKEPSGSVTIAPIGPLSNIAMALQRAPDIAARVKQIVLMGGGCFEGGNITPAAEFNIYVDPHAAAVVFGAGIPITMMPLDVTHKALTTEKRNEALQMLVLEPRLAVLDETDSGLDIDALRIVAGGVNALRDSTRGILMITHYQRLLDYIQPDFVHVLADGRIQRSGGPELAKELEANGYAAYTDAAA